jgi:hypothetical protein
VEKVAHHAHSALGMTHLQNNLKQSLGRKMKTVLAPNAPWPNHQLIEKQKKTTIKKRNHPIVKLDNDLDYFAETREQLQAIKDSKKSRARDVTTGRFKGDNRLSG